MKKFAAAPWKDPEIMDSSGRLSDKGPPEFFKRYLKNTPGDRGPSANLTGPGASNYMQCDLNPGVALDKDSKKFTLLKMENGNPKTVGRFHVEQEGLEGYNGYNDMQTKGPLGIAGVPLSVGNVGPPGVAILNTSKDRNWQWNTRNRPPRLRENHGDVVLDENNSDNYSKHEPEYAKKYFSYYRLGSEFARQEMELAEDAFNSIHHLPAPKGREGRQPIAVHLRSLQAGMPSLSLEGAFQDVKDRTRLHGIYDNRGLFIASSHSEPTPHQDSGLHHLCSPLCSPHSFKNPHIAEKMTYCRKND